MGKLTFKGGIHPYEGKELSKNRQIEKYLPKGEMVYPLSCLLYTSTVYNRKRT